LQRLLITHIAHHTLKSFYVLIGKITTQPTLLASLIRRRQMFSDSNYNVINYQKQYVTARWRQ